MISITIFIYQEMCSKSIASPIERSAFIIKDDMILSIEIDY